MRTLAEHDGGLGDLPHDEPTLKDREQDRSEGLEVVADAYLTKSSFHDQTFLTTVADLIGEARDE